MAKITPDNIIIYFLTGSFRSLIQRFGGSLNLNVHFHQLFIDGSYEIGPQNEPIDFIAIAQPTLPELDQVLQQIIKRLTKYLER